MKIKLNMPKTDNLWSTFIRIGSSTLAQFFVLFVILIGINVISQKLFLRIDLTKNNIYTLSQGSKNIVSGLEAPVTIKVFFSENIPPDVISVTQDTKDIFEEYVRYSNGKVILDVKNPTDENFKEEATEAGVPEIQYSSISSDKVEIAEGFLGVSIQYKENKEVIPVITDAANLEYETTSRIYELTHEEKLTIGFLTGHGEKALFAEYSRINEGLSRQFEIEEISLSDGKPIDPEKVKVLVIAGPLEIFSERDMFEIDQYIMRGGNVIFLVDNYTLAYQDPTLNKSEINVNELLKQYGVEVKEAVLMDESFLPIPGVLPVAYPYWVEVLRENMDTGHPALSNLESVVFFWSFALNKVDENDSRSFTPLLKTTNKAWEKAGGDVIDVNFEEFVAPPNQSQYTLAMLIEGKQVSKYKDKKVPRLAGEDVEDKRDKDTPRTDEVEDARIIVIGDSDFISDSFVDGSQSNPVFFANLLEWLASGEDLIEIRSKNVTQYPLDPTEESEKWLIKAANVALIPVLLIGAGIGYNVMRRKKQSSI